MQKQGWRVRLGGLLCLVAVVALALSLAACGGDDDSDSASEATSSSSDAGVAEAKEKISGFIGKPSPFPVTEKLERVPEGATIAYVDCGTPVCALIRKLASSAAKTMGVKLSVVKAGTQANEAANGLNTVISQEPDAVIVTALDTQLWKNQLETLQDMDIPVVTLGNSTAQDYGVVSPQGGKAQSTRDGALMADYVAANWGPDAKVVFYETPELSFTQVLLDAFTSELEEVCPNCSVRTAEVPVASIGNKAPSQVVSDLQANPDTDVAIFGTDEIQLGLPAALKTAGLEVKTLGYNPAPGNLEYIKNGQETAGLSSDLPVSSWTLVDQAARLIIGQELSGDEAKGIGDVQFLTQEDITFDPSNGWTGYPDFAERFATLWGVKAN